MPTGATSQTFSVIETGEALMRNDEPSPTRSAVLVRLLHSHIRIGSFQRLAYLNKPEELKKLTQHVVRHHYAALDPEAEIKELAPAFIRALAGRVAEMVAGWMAAGFVHGVLNTDNFNVTGESFDYGPWRFLPYFDPSFTAAYFDHQRRYAFGRQPQAANVGVVPPGRLFYRNRANRKIRRIIGAILPAARAKII